MTKDFLSLTGQEKKRIAERLLSSRVAEAKGGAIRAGGGKTVIQAAIDWVAENCKGGADTLIGRVIIGKKSVKFTLGHGFSQRKLDAIPAIRDVLEKGEYLGFLDDFGGATIRNHYFAGRVGFSDGDRIVLCRVRKADGDNANRFYVHEALAEGEIQGQGALLQTAAAHSGDGKPHGGMPLCIAILHEILESVKGTEEPGA